MRLAEAVVPVPPRPAAKASLPKVLPAMKLPPWPKLPAKLSRNQMIAAGGAAVALLLMFGLLSGNRKSGVAPQAITQVSVKVHTTPAGATILVNKQARGVSDFQLDLPAGTYEIEAQLEGYQSKTATFEAKVGAANSLDLGLDPALPVVKLSSDAPTGKVFYDDQPPADLAGAEWSLDKIAPGDHKLKFDGPQGSASFNFTTEAGAVPVIKGTITAKGVLAVVVSCTWLEPSASAI